MIRLILAFTVAALAAACVSAPVREAVPMPWPERRAALQADDAFALNGRVAISAPGGSGVNATLRWQQEGDLSRVSLDGPLGIGGAQVELRGDHLELRTSRGEELQGDAARAELERRVGFALPLVALRYWVRGVPAPAEAAEEVVDETHQRLTRLVQDGWAIDYPAYLDGATIDLPRRLSARRGETRVQLVVDRWTP